MSTTVTTSTMTAISTLTITSLAAIAIVTFMILLIQKQILVAMGGDRARRLSKALNPALILLGIVFGALVALKVSEILY